MPVKSWEMVTLENQLATHTTLVPVKLSSVELEKLTGWVDKAPRFGIADMSGQRLQEPSWDDTPRLRFHFSHIWKHLELQFMVTSELNCHSTASQISCRSEKSRG